MAFLHCKYIYICTHAMYKKIPKPVYDPSACKKMSGVLGGGGGPPAATSTTALSHGLVQSAVQYCQELGGGK